MSATSSTTVNGTAIQEIAELQKAATELKIVPSNDSRGTYYLRKPDGTVDTVIPPQPYTNDVLATPQELVAYVGNRAHETSVAIVTPTGINWRRDFLSPKSDVAQVPLKYSAAWTVIAAMAAKNYSGSVLAHWDLYRLLRVTLKGCLPSGSNLADLVRTMKWTSDGEISSTLEQSKKMLGASMAHKVASGIDTIPESFVVTINVYDNFVSPKQIAIDLDTMPDTQQFRLTPYPGSIETAQMQTLDTIRDLFAFAGDGNTTLCEAYIGV